MTLNSDTSSLLRAIARSRAADAGPTIAELAANITCWNETIDGAQDHGVLTLLYRALISAKAQIPDEAMNTLRSGFERNAFQCFANASELLQVLKSFEQASIPAMPFKGVVLGAVAYGDITARTAGDLDVMIDPRDIQRATSILRDRGYELKTASRPDGMPAETNEFEYHFERESDGMVIELRWRLELSSPRFKRDLGMDWVWPTRRSVELAGASVPCLDPSTLLLMLCMHGSKHAWSRLTWVCDVSRVLESHPELNWKEVRREARRTGLERTLALGVLLSHRMAQSPVPDEVLRSLERDSGARKLADFFDENMLSCPGSLPPGRTPYGVRLLSFRDKLRAFSASELLKPTDRDRAAISLPRSLHALYYLVRPIRVLLDRSAR